jgi:hypothetical protein
MPASSPNGRPPANDAPQVSTDQGGGLAEVMAEAETLRTVLQDASARTARLLSALKQQRRQSRVVQAAMASLRQLRLDR